MPFIPQERDLRDLCSAVHEDSGAVCYLPKSLGADHGPNHYGWTHYPGQYVVWPVEEKK